MSSLLAVAYKYLVYIRSDMPLWDKIKNEFLNPHSHLRHKIPMDVTRTLADFTGQFVNKKMPPDAQRWLDANANDVITRVVVKRAPVSKNIERFLNLASGGRFTQGKEELGYDDFFHLSLVIEHQYIPYGKHRDAEPGPVKHAQLEKLERVSFTSRISEAPNTEALEVTIPKGYQIGRVIRDWMDDMGDRFYQYDAFSNNCQTFVAGFLKAMGVLNPKTSGFVYQNAGQLLEKQPGYLGDLARSITNLLAIVDQVVQGGTKKKRKGGINPKELREAVARAREAEEAAARARAAEVTEKRRAAIEGRKMMAEDMASRHHEKDDDDEEEDDSGPLIVRRPAGRMPRLPPARASETALPAYAPPPPPEAKPKSTPIDYMTYDMAKGLPKPPPGPKLPRRPPPPSLDLKAQTQHLRENLRRALAKYEDFKKEFKGNILGNIVKTKEPYTTFINLENSDIAMLRQLNEEIMQAYYGLLEDINVSDDEEREIRRILQVMENNMRSPGGFGQMKGLGVYDVFRNASRSYSKAVSGVVNTVWDQVKNKDSLTRKHLIPAAKEVADVAQPILDVYAPGSGTAVKSVVDSIDCANKVATSAGYGRAPRHMEMERLATELNEILHKVNKKLMPKAHSGDLSVIPEIRELLDKWYQTRARMFGLAEYLHNIPESESESESESEEAARRGRGQLRRRIGKAMNSLLE